MDENPSTESTSYSFDTDISMLIGKFPDPPGKQLLNA